MRWRRLTPSSSLSVGSADVREGPAAIFVALLCPLLDSVEWIEIYFNLYDLRGSYFNFYDPGGKLFQLLCFWWKVSKQTYPFTDPNLVLNRTTQDEPAGICVALLCPLI